MRLLVAVLCLSGAALGQTVVQQCSNYNVSGNITSLTCTFASNVTAGDSIIVEYGSNQASSGNLVNGISMPGVAFSPVQKSATKAEAGIWCAPYEPYPYYNVVTVTWPNTGANNNFVIAQEVNSPGGCALSGTPASSNGTTTTISTGTATTVTKNTLVIGVFNGTESSAPGTNPASSPSAAFADLSWPGTSAQYGLWGAAYLSATSSGAKSTTWTNANATGWDTEIAAFAGGVCTGPQSTSNWSSATSWSCTGTSNTVPGNGDIAVINNPMTLDTNVGTTGGGGILDIILEGRASTTTNPSLTSDCLSPHTITFGSTGSQIYSNLSGIEIEPVLYSAPAVTSLDLSLNCSSASDVVTVQNANSNPFFLFNEPGYNVNSFVVNANYVVLNNCGNSVTVCGFIQGGANSLTVNMNHIELGPGCGQFTLPNQNMTSGSPSFQNVTWINRYCTYGVLLGGQNQSGNPYVFSNLTDFQQGVEGGDLIEFEYSAPDNFTLTGSAALGTSSYSSGFFSNFGTQNTVGPLTVNFNAVAYDPARVGDPYSAALNVSVGSAAGSAISYNMAENNCEAFTPGGTGNSGATSVTWEGNWGSTNYSGSAPGSVCQGTVFFDNSQASTTIIDRTMMYFSSVDPVIGIFGSLIYGAGGHQTANLTVSRWSIYFPTSPTGNQAMALNVGDAGVSGINGVLGVNNIIQNGSQGFFDTSSNVWSTAGTGGVGISNNDVYGTYQPYATYGTSTNFGTGHPNPAYGDVTLNPGFVNVSRKMEDFDTYLGGPGTLLHLFQEFAARDGLAQITGQAGGLVWNSNYTPQAMYPFLTAGFAPTNAALAAKASDGGTIGAQPVYISGFWR